MSMTVLTLFRPYFGRFFMRLGRENSGRSGDGHGGYTVLFRLRPLIPKVYSVGFLQSKGPCLDQFYPTLLRLPTPPVSPLVVRFVCIDERTDV